MWTSVGVGALLTLQRIAEAHLTIVKTINNKEDTEVHRGKMSLWGHMWKWESRNLNPYWSNFRVYFPPYYSTRRSQENVTDRKTIQHVHMDRQPDPKE